MHCPPDSAEKIWPLAPVCLIFFDTKLSETESVLELSSDIPLLLFSVLFRLVLQFFCLPYRFQLYLMWIKIVRGPFFLLSLYLTPILPPAIAAPSLPLS
jgi:hypothetical protein